MGTVPWLAGTGLSAPEVPHVGPQKALGKET